MICVQAQNRSLTKQFGQLLIVPKSSKHHITFRLVFESPQHLSNISQLPSGLQSSTNLVSKRIPIPGVNQNPLLKILYYFQPSPVDGSEIRRSPVEEPVVYPIVCRMFIHSRWLAFGFLNHQQYHGKNTKQYQGWQQKP